MNCQITHNKEFFQFLLTNFLGNIGIGIQDNSGLQRVADQFFLTRALKRLSNHAAQFQKLGNLGTRLMMSILWLR